MSYAADAILQDAEGRFALRFERVLRHPTERVWSALTDPDEQFGWHPTPAEFEPAAGGAVAYLEGGDVPDMADGVLTHYEPPRLLAYTWGDDHLRWELRPHDDGCMLVLTHTFDDRLKAARDADGWQMCLEALDALLAGSQTDLGRTFALRRDRAAARPPEPPAKWRQLNSSYERRFGISAADATPPPSRG